MAIIVYMGRAHIGVSCPPRTRTRLVSGEVWGNRHPPPGYAAPGVEGTTSVSSLNSPYAFGVRDTGRESMVSRSGRGKLDTQVSKHKDRAPLPPPSFPSGLPARPGGGVEPDVGLGCVALSRNGPTSCLDVKGSKIPFSVSTY